jgi:hypothetical protein
MAPGCRQGFISRVDRTSRGAIADLRLVRIGFWEGRVADAQFVASFLTLSQKNGNHERNVSKAGMEDNEKTLFLADDETASTDTQYESQNSEFWKCLNPLKPQDLGKRFSIQMNPRGFHRLECET